MSPRDLPLWARGAAAALVLFASWWLVHSPALSTAVGASAGWIGAGVVAAFALRGMHLPLGLWPEGPMRTVFRPGWVIGTSGVFAVLVLLAHPATSPPLASWFDRGAYALVVIGVVGWGFAVAFVEQRPFAAWFIAAGVAALVPAAAALFAGAGTQACWFATDASQVPCVAGVVQAAAFTGAVITAAAFVTSELAFRRLLLGRAAGAGLILVLASAVVAALWQVVLDPSAVDGMRLAWWAGGGLAAGSLYARSGSLVVSSLYMGLLAAGDAAVRYGTSVPDQGHDTPMLSVHLAAALVLAALVVRRNGVFAGLRTVEDESDLRSDDAAEQDTG